MVNRRHAGFDPMFQILISITFEQPAAMASSATSTQVEAQQPPATKLRHCAQQNLMSSALSQAQPSPAFYPAQSIKTRLQSLEQSSQSCSWRSSTEQIDDLDLFMSQRGVVFFRNQNLTPERQVAFASKLLSLANSKTAETLF
jgi:hypothetical protein